MEKVINIYSKGETIDLEAVKYHIDVLGGWGVNDDEFMILFKHKITGCVVDCTKAFWKIQSYAYGKKAKRIFTLDVIVAGTYEVEFINAEMLIVRSTNLFFSSLFEKPVPNNGLSVYIHR